MRNTRIIQIAGFLFMALTCSDSQISRQPDARAIVLFRLSWIGWFDTIVGMNDKHNGASEYVSNFTCAIEDEFITFMPFHNHYAIKYLS